MQVFCGLFEHRFGTITSEPFASVVRRTFPQIYFFGETGSKVLVDINNSQLFMLFEIQ
jgi:hypothetical protein